jgi:hypothetical protein
MNPFEVLKIDYRADKQEIMQAAARAMRERRFSAREVALAQKALLNPVTKAAHDFLHFIDVRPLQAKLRLNQPDDSAASASPTSSSLARAGLKRLSIFDEKP